MKHPNKNNPAKKKDPQPNSDKPFVNQKSDYAKDCGKKKNGKK